ncbi:hypothetical protein B1H10_03195 [candidate division KSB1 bacterium 4484_188]|nr:MAG: hypothetical protein B1H10_03195 [candidate division KSB1 bacterium 4484_188]
MNFADILKSPAAEGKEKHVPVIEVEDGAVRVIVGKEVAHPNTAEHGRIVWKWDDLANIAFIRFLTNGLLSFRREGLCISTHFFL